MSVQTRAESIGASTNNKIHIQIGDICCSITCDDEEVYSYLRQQYINFLSSKPADISISFEIVDGLSTAEIKKAMRQARCVREGDRFVTTHMAFEGEYDAANRSLSMKVEKHLFDPALEYKLMNRIIPDAYYSVCGAQNGGKPQAMLVHSCCIVRHGRALIFTGPSGTGKTTVGRLCGDEYGQVINDEMVLVSRPDKDSHELIVQGAPIIGEIPQRLNISVPLACIILLKQSARTAFRRLSRLEAYQSFIRQVIAPKEMKEDNTVRQMLEMTTGLGDEVSRSAVFYELEFNLDREVFWEAVSELEKSLEKGVIAK